MFSGLRPPGAWIGSQGSLKCRMPWHRIRPPRLPEILSGVTKIGTIRESERMSMVSMTARYLTHWSKPRRRSASSESSDLTSMTTVEAGP